MSFSVWEKAVPNHQAAVSDLQYEEQAIKWTAPQRERYYEIAEKCDESTTLQTAYTSLCMKKRGYYMVDHSQYVLAVWSGAPRSGTW